MKLPRLRRSAAPLALRAVTSLSSLDFGGGEVVYTPSWDRQRGIADGHDRESLVAAITEKVAADVANLAEFPLKARQGGSERDVTDTHWLTAAFNIRANAGMSAVTLRRLLSYDLDFAGEAYLRRTGTGSNLKLSILTGEHVSVVRAAPGSTYADGTRQMVWGYEIRDEMGVVRERIPEASGELVRIHFPHPADPVRANAPAERAGLPIDILHYMRLSTRSLLQNDGMPAGVLSVKDPTVSSGSILDLERRFNRRAHDPSRKGRTIVVDAQTDYTPVGSTQAGKDWTALYEMGRNDVFAVWAMPPALLGMGGARTYENQQVEIRQYLRSTIVTRLHLIAAELNKWTRQENVEVYFDLSECEALAEGVAEKAEMLLAAYTARAVTVNEYRDALGLPPVEGGDELPAAPAPPALPPAPEPVQDDEEPAEVLQDEAPTEGERGASPHLDGREAAFRYAVDPEAWLDAWTRGEEKGLERLAEFAQRYHARVYQRITGALKRHATLQHRAPDDPAPEVDPADVLGAKYDEELRDDLPSELSEAELLFIAELAEELGEELPDVQDRLDRILRDRTERLVDGYTVDGEVRTRGWNRALVEDLRGALTVAVAEGFTIEQAAARVAEVLGVDPAKPGKVGTRALTIARTEIIGLANQSFYAHAVDSGVVRALSWSAARDSRARPSHIEAANTYGLDNPNRLGEPFRVGSARLLHPGDPAGPAKETVNCRCVTIPVVG